jgi:hypothetical protein
VARTFAGEYVMIEQLHLIRPLWLVALPVLWLLAWWLARRRAGAGDWSQVVDRELLVELQLDAAQAQRRSPWPWLALAWTLAVVALAGPSWQQTRTAAYHGKAAWVLVLDLSPSMAATDLAPNRYTRARYALDDLLAATRDARVGLVVFSVRALYRHAADAGRGHDTRAAAAAVARHHAERGRKP